MSTTRSLAFTVPLGLAAVLFTQLASAQSTCEANTDCPKGYECQVTGGTACASTDCAEGQDCPPPPPCEPEEFKNCVAVPDACASDADCDSGMVCYTHTYERCDPQPAYACAPDQECPEPPPPQCETATESSCVPRYMLPCDAAADCGTGFECQPVEECACSGSSGGGSVPPSDGAGGAPDTGEPLPPDEPTCSCTPTDVSYCAIIERACTSDAECPTDWVCSDNPESVVCSGPDGSGEGAECGSTEPDKVCMPPYAYTVIAVGRDGTPVYASDDDAGNAAGIPEGSPTAGGDADDGDASDSSASGGCSVSGRTSGGGAWLTLLGLAALVRLRLRKR